MFLYCITSFAQFYHESIQVSPSRCYMHASQAPINQLLFVDHKEFMYLNKDITNLGTHLNVEFISIYTPVP